MNRISLLATCLNAQKSAVIQRLSAEMGDAHQRVLRALQDHKEAYAAYIGFSHGYVGFHIGNSRYRLDELNLQPVNSVEKGKDDILTKSLLSAEVAA